MLTAPAVPHSRLLIVGGAILVLAAVKLFVAGSIGLSFDESYYTFWSENLAIGYLDHPPMVAYLIAAGRAIFGDDPFGVRFFAVACGLLTTGLVYRLGMLLADRATAVLAALLYAATPASGLVFLMTPDPPSALFFAATLWAVAEWLASGRRWWWLIAGAMAGLGLWSKYTDAFLAPGLLLFLLASRERRGALASWPVWAGAALALIVFLPVILWNGEHGWASFTFQGQRTVTSGLDPNWAGNLLDLLGGQALYQVPVLVLLALAGLVTFFVRRGAEEWRGLSLPVWASLPALLYFAFHAFHAHVEANWLIPLWPSLTLAGAMAVVALWQRRPRLTGWLVGAQFAIGAALTAAIYVQALWQPFDVGDLDRTNETRGWAKLVDDLGRLAEANGAHWIATSSNFGTTGELASYSLFANSPLPVRQIDEPLLQPIYDLVSPRMAFGRVALIGDAAFVARPHVASGVMKAALDAESLADALSGAGGDVAAALSRYNADRQPYGAWLVERGRHIGASIASRDMEPGLRSETIMREYGAAGLVDEQAMAARVGN